MAKQSVKGFKRVVFTVNAEPGSDVCVAGTFNNWNLSDKRLVDKNGTGKFTLSIMLAPGEYQYKLIVNGVWCVDPSCKDWVANDVGSLNSVLRVG